MQNSPINIDNLIHARSVEDNRREFKATWNDAVKESVVRSVCAFANDLHNLNGGYIILGIDTDERGLPILPPCGLGHLDLDQIQCEIRGQCNRIDPMYQPLVFPETHCDKTILIIWAPGGDNRPYQAPKRARGGEREYYVRQGSSTVEARGEIRTQLIAQTARIPFDDRRNLRATVDAISPTLVRRFLSQVQSDLIPPEANIADSDLYRRMRIVVQINDHFAPRNAALLFFSETPERFFLGAQIEIVQFADHAGGDLIAERTIAGPLNDQVSHTLAHLNSLTEVILKKQPRRAEVERVVAYPYEAIEEAVVNAVYHRSYDNLLEPTKIYVYPDRLEIISYPGPLHGIEARHFAPGSVVPPVPARNRRIGEFLKELRLAEGRGTGLPKIRRRMAENGSPEPQFDYDEGRTYFRVTLLAHPRHRVIHAVRESALLWSTGDRRAALSHLAMAFEALPNSGALASQLINYLMTTDDLETAQRVLTRFDAQPAKTEIVQPYFVYAEALIDKNQPTKARRILEMIPTSELSEDGLKIETLRKRLRNAR